MSAELKKKLQPVIVYETGKTIVFRTVAECVMYYGLPTLATVYRSIELGKPFPHKPNSPCADWYAGEAPSVPFIVTYRE